MQEVVRQSQETFSFTIVCDERCNVVRRLGALVKLWDRQHIFTFVDRESNNVHARKLIQELDACQWSLILIDDMNQRWYGPEAIPIILKNLPFGKSAAVFYILPGTWWLTKQLYLLVSRSRRRFQTPPTAAVSS